MSTSPRRTKHPQDAARAGFDLFAVTAPGLAAVCRDELAGLGIDAAVEEGGVAWRGDRSSLYRANLECRTASRILARVGTFRARTFAELERHAARLPWERFIGPGATVSLRVTARKSRLYHTGAVAERLAAVLAAGPGVRVAMAAAETSESPVSDGSDVDEPAWDGALLVVVRLFRDGCTVSADSSGALLHQRGYRQALAKAPLRETIAAAMLLATGWRGDSPLVDPLCGAGTIPIEAALLARRIPPGLARPDLRPRAYAFEAWPGHDPALWARLVAQAQERVLPAAPSRIEGTDAHGGAIAAAQANALRAGVAADLVFGRRPLADFTAPPGSGTGRLVTNPPYGVRVGERRELRALYTELGRAARRAGWGLAWLSADRSLDAAVGAALGAPVNELLATRNGGIAVRLMAWPTP